MLSFTCFYVFDLYKHTGYQYDLEKEVIGLGFPLTTQQITNQKMIVLAEGHHRHIPYNIKKYIVLYYFQSTSTSLMMSSTVHYFLCSQS